HRLLCGRRIAQNECAGAQAEACRQRDAIGKFPVLERCHEHLPDFFFHHSRFMNSKPSSFLAQSTMGVLLRKAITAGSILAGSPSPNFNSATTTSHSSLKPTESRFSPAPSVGVR